MKLSKIILDDHAVALNDLLLTCRRSATHFSRAAHILEDEDNFFEATYLRRDQACDQIETIMRTMNYLPKEPDPDREAVAGLATHAETLLSRDERALLLRKAARYQREIKRHFDRVRQLDWPSPIRAKIDEIERQLYSIDFKD